MRRKVIIGLEGIKKVVDIGSGVINKGLKGMGILSREMKEEQERRLSICRGCSIYNNGYCDSRRYELIGGEKVYGCGCNIELKSLSATSKCPLRKW